MSVPKFKRRESGLEYVDNAFELQKEIMTLASKLRCITRKVEILFFCFL